MFDMLHNSEKYAPKFEPGKVKPTDNAEMRALCNKVYVVKQIDWPRIDIPEKAPVGGTFKLWVNRAKA